MYSPFPRHKATVVYHLLEQRLRPKHCGGSGPRGLTACRPPVKTLLGTHHRKHYILEATRSVLLPSPNQPQLRRQVDPSKPCPPTTCDTSTCVLVLERATPEVDGTHPLHSNLAADTSTTSPCSCPGTEDTRIRHHRRLRTPAAAAAAAVPLLLPP